MFLINSPLANDEVELGMIATTLDVNVEYAAAVGYLDRWSSSLGSCILEAVLWRCTTEACPPAATDKASEGTYCVRDISRISSWREV